MIKLEKTEVIGWEHAIRGMRNPMNSWDKSDSGWGIIDQIDTGVEPINVPGYVVGVNDLKLMKSLAKSGTDHRKFMRMIAVYVDITAPLYWWKEFDTYKVGTVANSCSTMHKIHAKEFELDDFSHEHLLCPVEQLFPIIAILNDWRNKYLEAKTKPMKEEAKRSEVMKRYWWQMIQLLPSSFNQKRTIMLNYEVLANIYKSRKNHKLDEWVDLCKWIESLPYSELITGKEDVDEANDNHETGKGNS